MSQACRIMSEMQRKEEKVRRGTSKCKKTTHILANTQARDKSVYRDQESERYAQTRECRVEEEGMSKYIKKESEQGPLTPWIAQTEGQVRTRKESKPARGTHVLDSPDGGTSQDKETIRASEGHSPTG
jgi:hypothetical protein